MKKLGLLAAVALATSIIGGAASASIIYDNGAPNSVSGNEATAWLQTEDFSFLTNTSVTGAGVYLLSLGSGWDGSFQYTIFDDNTGSPGALLASGSVTPAVTDSGAPSCCGPNSFLYAFDFASTFNAAAGATYHLGIHAAGDYNGDSLYWTTTALNATATGFESYQGTQDNWYDNGQEHAFYLTSAVPEPASWALMISGFGLAGASLRRRRLSIAA
jgi:hypothetical protein